MEKLQRTFDNQLKKDTYQLLLNRHTQNHVYLIFKAECDHIAP